MKQGVLIALILIITILLGCSPNAPVTLPPTQETSGASETQITKPTPSSLTLSSPSPSPTLAPPSPSPRPVPFSTAPAISPTPTTSSALNINRTTHGVIKWNETWRGEIRIIGDIYVAEQATLTIEPGTKVLIAANQDVENQNTLPPSVLKQGIKQEHTFQDGVHFGQPFRDEANHISINIAGTLLAVGTPDRMITITSDSSAPGIYDWNSLLFRKGVLSYCQIEYYRSLDCGEGTEVSHNVLRHVGECCISLQGRSAILEYNTMSDAGHELIDMHGGAPTIRYNKLGPNPNGAGITIDGGSPYIVSNTFEDCRFGMLFISSPGNPTIKDNTFKGNREDIHNFGDTFK